MDAMWSRTLWRERGYVVLGTTLAQNGMNSINGRLRHAVTLFITLNIPQSERSHDYIIDVQKECIR